jgi:CRISPR/Cas system-associated endoribonuclease Cas2
MTLEELKQTVLYKSLFECLANDEDWSDIEKNLLQVACSKLHFIPKCKSVSQSFVWIGSSQGQDYWSGIDQRWRKYANNI